MPYPTYGLPSYTPYQPSYQPNYPQNPYPQIQAQPSAPQNNISNQPVFACRPVTSKEEATAIQVDFFGPGTIMPDLGHNVIYLKRFNSQTGACDIFEFAAQQPKEDTPVQYVTKEEFESLREELEKLKVKRVKKNDADE